MVIGPISCLTATMSLTTTCTLLDMQEQLEPSVSRRQKRPTRERIQQAQERLEDPEPWMVIMPQIRHCWLGASLHEHIEDLEDEAIGCLVSLAITEGKYGTVEACMIIYHVLNDRRDGWRPSIGWLNTTCGEARAALRDPQK